MAKKFQYPVTEDYTNWSINDAIRDLVSNGLDAEIEHGARFETRYDAKKEVLHLINRGVTLPVTALYFGGSTKKNDKRLIGQYGEGLKLAMLVFARGNYALNIRNGAEVWTPTIEVDKLGQKVLTVNMRDAKFRPDFEVEIPNLSSEGWHHIQDMFLALRAPTKKAFTTYGEVLYDPEFVGKIYVKGVYCTTRPNYSTGYNFFDLDTGRDRRIPHSWDMDGQIRMMWQELISQDKASGAELYKLMRANGGEADAFQYSSDEKLAGAVAEAFRTEFGEASIPTASIADAAELEHLGRTGVVVPRSLAQLLKSQFPTKEAVQKLNKEEVVEIIQYHDLTFPERDVLVHALKVVGQVTGADIGAMTSVVLFRDRGIVGLHSQAQIQIARSQLESLGRTVVTLIHEYAHEFGGDGEHSHVARMQSYMEQVVDYLSKESR